MKFNIVELGVLSYEKSLEIQTKLLEMRQKNQIDNTLLLVEHPPVITLGTRGRYENIYLSPEERKERGVQVFEVSRGGDVTYHGPGQIVGYPIFDLRDVEKDIRLFIQKIEQSLIDLLKDNYGIDARRQQDAYTGVWVQDKKIAAIGLSVKKWVTMHGFAFNVNTDLSHFNWINPCGLSKGVTSVEELTGQKQDMAAVLAMVEAYFAAAFGYDAQKTDIAALIDLSE